MKRCWLIAAVLAASLVGGAAGMLAQGGLASAAFGGGGPRGDLGAYFFGPRMARAEVVMVVQGQVRDFRIDQGRVVSVRPDALELLERDRTRQTVPLAAHTRVQLPEGPGTIADLRRGMHVIAVREANSPAELLRVVPKLARWSR